MYSPYGIVLISGIAAGLVVINVVLHYEVLNLLSTLLMRLAWVGRPRIALLICALLLVHIAEIWIFAGGIMLAEWHGGIGDLQGEHSNGMLDYVYYSSMTYTAVGYGDLFPSGPLRFIAAMEALLGLMLISWSASFTYLEMQRFWPDLQLKPEKHLSDSVP
ncbi:MAG: potassium channel family protein [Planctomycetota bacterium]|nr:potassium channel family protein [Planctomycetota bacterium]MDA1178141.1 potassium channel family protein [Planctomycetota bacterium]